MTMEAAIAFRSALLGVKVMHNKRWVHRDLKPANIGILSGSSVLLDVGTSRQIPADERLLSAPGTVGTINYLAPELELEAYDLSIDIWSMGVILYQLTSTHGATAKTTRRCVTHSERVMRMLLPEWREIMRLRSPRRPKATYIVSAPYQNA
jgi:serine/threonine protein kinase